MDSVVGCVPLVVDLSPRDNHREDAAPEPLILLIPRTSYLMAVASLVREAFAAFALSLGKPLAVWLCVGGGERSIPWHYPVGVIYDLFAAPRNESGGAAKPLFLTARMTPAITDSPSDVPLCVVGNGTAVGGSVDPNSTNGVGSSTTEDAKRQKREVQHAVSVFVRQCLKASLASSFGTTRHFFTLDPSSSDALSTVLTETEESSLLDGGGLLRYCKAKEALLKQAGVAFPDKYLVALYDTALDTATPKLVTIPAAQVHKDEDGSFTFLQMLALIAKNLGSAEAFFSLVPSAIQMGNDGESPCESASEAAADVNEQLLCEEAFERARASRIQKQGGLAILVGGVELPMKAPAALVVKHFLGFDFRLHIVLVKRVA